MFDVLVDESKKRLYLFLIIACLILELVILLDLCFAVDVINARSFTDLLDLQYGNEQSFYSYFFFSCLGSDILYTSFSLTQLLTTVGLVIRSFSLLDWLLLVILTGLIISHRSARSKVSLCLIGGFFLLRLLLLGGITTYLLMAVQTNSAIEILSRIHLSGIVLLLVQILCLVINTYWCWLLMNKNYLPLFTKNDSHSS